MPYDLLNVRVGGAYKVIEVVLIDALLHRDVKGMYRDTYLTKYFKEHELMPIPLTPEILRANGFVSKGREWRHIEYRDIEVSLRIDSAGKPLWTGVGEVAVNVVYVHTFQQILRLAGYEEFAKNFRV